MCAKTLSHIRAKTERKCSPPSVELTHGDVRHSVAGDGQQDDSAVDIVVTGHDVLRNEHGELVHVLMRVHAAMGDRR